MANAARSFRPTITATVTPASIDVCEGETGRYAVLKGATIQKRDGSKMTKTILAFGKAQKALEGRLTAGNPIALKIQYNGGTMRAVGLADEDDAPAAPKARKPNTLLQACIDAAGFEEHRNYAVA